MLDCVIYDHFSAVEYNIIVYYAEVINEVLWCSTPVGTTTRA